MRRQISSKSCTCTEGMGVDAAGISVKVDAHHPGRSPDLPSATAVERRRDGSVEVSRGPSKSFGSTEGLSMKCVAGALLSMRCGGADNHTEMCDISSGVADGKPARIRCLGVKLHGKWREPPSQDVKLDGTGGRTRKDVQSASPS